MKRILVPCNFSPCCKNALRFAAKLADKYGAEIIILTVLSFPETLFKSTQLDLQRKQARINFEKVKQTFGISVKITHEIKVGKILPVILEGINRKEIDLIVMGTKGSRGWQQMFMGSNTEKVVRLSPVPVFSVKSFVSIESIKNIVLPCDDLRYCQPEFIDRIKFLQKTFRARIHLLRINTSGKKEDISLESRLHEYVNQCSLTGVTCNVRSDEDEREGIIHFASEINADMIAISTYGNDDPLHLFTTSTAADVVNHTSLPVWTFAVNRKRAESKLPLTNQHA